MRVVPEHVAHVPVQADVVKEVVALENAMVLHHPQIGLAHKGLQNGGCDVRVVVGAQGVANVVQQGADDIFFVATIRQRQCGGLQRVTVPVDRKPSVVVLQQSQVR